MKKPKLLRVLAIGLAAALAVPMAACSAKNGANGSGTVKGGKITVWMPPFSSSNLSDEAFWKSELQNYGKKQGATISLQIIPWSNYEEKYMTAVTAGTAPDVGYMYMEMLSDYITMGELEPLDSYFTDQEKSNYIYIKKGVVQGKQYALPIVVGNVSVLFGNKKIMQKSGITAMPKTWQELVDDLLKIKKDSPSVYPFEQEWGDPTIGAMNNAFYPYFWQAGGSLFSADGKSCTVNSAAGLKAATFLHDLRYKYDLMPKSITSLNVADVAKQMADGKVAMAVLGTSYSSQLDKAGIDWDYTTSLTDKSGGTFCAADSLVMLSSSKNKTLAAKTMKFMTSPTVMEAFHSKIYSAPPISKNEKYMDNAKFEKMYQNDTGSFHVLTPVSGSGKVYQTLYKNLQLMMLNQLTPKAALDNTVTYSKTALGK